MTTLTFTKDCESCLRQERRIKELEVRITLLHKIHEDEEFLDSLAATATGLATAILEDPKPGSPPPGLSEEPRAMDPLPGVSSAPEDFPELVTKPKRPGTSGTTTSNPWITVGPQSGRKRHRNAPSRAASPPIPLANGFDLLGTLLEECQSSPRAKRVRGQTWGRAMTPPVLRNDVGDVDPPSEVVVPDRRGCTAANAGDVGDVDPSSEVVVPDRRGYNNNNNKGAHARDIPISQQSGVAVSNFYARPVRSRPLHTRSPPPPRSHPLHSRSPPPPPPPPPPPTVLIIGDSMVRNIHIPNAITYCYPGANTKFILDRLPIILASIPPTIKQLVLHVGVNDRQSVETRKNFEHILDLLLGCGKQIFISGPIPLLRRGEERFSRLLDMHYWLQAVCSSCGIIYIHNFHLFWARPVFYSRDGLHPSVQGNNSLSFHMKRILDTNAVSPA